MNNTIAGRCQTCRIPIDDHACAICGAIIHGGRCAAADPVATGMRCCPGCTLTVIEPQRAARNRRQSHPTFPIVAATFLMLAAIVVALIATA